MKWERDLRGTAHVFLLVLMSVRATTELLSSLLAAPAAYFQDMLWLRGFFICGSISSIIMMSLNKNMPSKAPLVCAPAHVLAGCHAAPACTALINFPCLPCHCTVLDLCICFVQYVQLLEAVL